MVRFYERVLRLQVARRWPSDRPEDRGADRSIWLRLGTGVLALESCSGDPEPPPWQAPEPGFHLLALEIAWQNRAIWLGHLALHNIEVVHQSPWTIYVRDPEGNRVGLSHFPFDANGQVLV